MLMDKDRVAEILLEIGTLLELKGENPFKTRAYVNAARTIESVSEAKIVAENRLGEIKGIGEALEKKITESVTGGDHSAESFRWTTRYAGFPAVVMTLKTVASSPVLRTVLPHFRQRPTRLWT